MTPVPHRRSRGGYCVSCLEDWPCAFERGRRTERDRIRGEVEAIPRRMVGPRARSRSLRPVVEYSRVRAVLGTGVVSAAEDGWPEVHRHVWARDRACVFSAEATLPPGVPRWSIPHVCWRWLDGTPIDWSHVRPGDGDLDHVREEGLAGRKPPDDSAHLVVTCSGLNRLGPSHDAREHERRVLAAYHPDVWQTFTQRRSADA